MRQPRGNPLTPQQHRPISQSIYDVRARLGAITRRTLNRRVPAPVLDAALRVEWHLATLARRLADDARDSRGECGGEATAGLYAADAPAMEWAPPPTGRRVSAEEHRTWGRQLYRLRDELLDLSARLAPHYPKSSPIGALPKPLRALDRLRCRLDSLLYAQHREHFDTRVYYPGHWADPGAALPTGTTPRVAARALRSPRVTVPRSPGTGSCARERDDH